MRQKSHLNRSGGIKLTLDARLDLMLVLQFGGETTARSFGRPQTRPEHHAKAHH